MIAFTGLRRSHYIALLAALSLAFVFTGAIDLLMRDRRDALKAVTDAQSNMTTALERDILRNVELYDLSLRAAGMGMGLLTSAMNVATQDAILFNGVSLAHHFGSILIADRSGSVLRDAGAAVPRISSLAAKPFFIAHRARSDLGLLVLIIQRGGITGRPYMSLSRRISAADGSFNGTVSGGLTLEYFKEIFSRFELPQGASIDLDDENGRHVVGSAAAAADSPFSAAALARLKGADPVLSESGFGNSKRIATSRRLGRLPFYLSVSTPTEAVYAQWRKRAWVVGAALIGFVGVTWSLIIAMAREASRRFKAEQAAKIAAEAAKVSERKLGTYIDYLADGILAIRMTSDGRFLYEHVNAAAATMLGIRPEDAIGRQPKEVWGASMGEVVERRLRKCLSDGLLMRYDHVHELPTTTRVLRFILTPVHGSGDPSTTALMLASLRDVSDAVTMEAQLRQAQRLEAVGQLTAGVAHDFNNLLQAQVGALELLLNDIADRPKALARVKLALSAAERGSSLTHSLLSFSRKQHLAPRAVPVQQLLEGLQRMLSRTLERKVELRLCVQEKIAAPFADVAQLEAAVLNLTLNARDAMMNGGIITIEARNGTSSDEVVNGLETSNCVLLAVSDDGMGMPPDVAARACEPFFTTKEVGRGSGLGLSMVQGFVQQSGGAMLIQSEPGKGTRVELWIPRAPTIQPALAPVASGILPDLGAGWRILLVDDEPDLLAVTAELLEDRGFTVVRAASGADALRLLETDRAFDMLITDYMMPEIDGAELIRQASGIVPSLPMLLITGYAQAELLSGLPSYVEVARKPMRGDELVRRVAGVLQRAEEQTKLARVAA